MLNIKLIIKKIALLILKALPDFKIFNKFILTIRFKKRVHQKLDFNNLDTLNKYLQYIKVYDHNPLYTKIADKVAVREYVSEKIGDKYLIPMNFYGVELDEIATKIVCYDKQIIKVNHDCSGGLIIRDINKLLLNVKEVSIPDFKVEQFETVEEYNIEYIKYFIRQRMSYNHYYSSKEWQYKNITPMFLSEALLEDSMGCIPNDYKFHCFNGKVEFIYISADRENGNYRKIYYPDWTEAPFTWTKIGNEKKFIGPNIPKPTNFDEMIEVAEKLSQDFKYIRVDLYGVDESIYFGELTLQHGSGFEPILPEKFDKYYRSLIC